MSPIDIQEDLAKGLKQLMDDQPLLELVHAHNEWFIPELVKHALKAMLPWFTEPLPPFLLHNAAHTGTIGIVMAGNIPLVGLHDLWMVLLAGHRALIRTSSKDALLMRRLISQLCPENQDRITFTDDLDPKEIDFLIATGSNNTARYLEQRYANVPRLIRKNRFSVGILQGNETASDLTHLVEDVLFYHGMGCRSVSNLLVLKGVDLRPFQAALTSFPRKWLADAWFKVVAWENATRQMVNEDHLTHSTVAFEWRESMQTAPVGVLNLVPWETETDLMEQLETAKESIQCTIGHQGLGYGMAQCPSVTDFADGVNSYALLLEITPGIGRR